MDCIVGRFFGFFIFLTTVSAWAQSLGPDYNLGRLTGGPQGSQFVRANASDPYSISDHLSLRLGKESLYQWDFNMAPVAQGHEDQTSVGLVPYSLSVAARPDIGHQVSFWMYTPNFSYWYLNGEHQSGQSNSAVGSFSTAIDYKMVSRDGHIDIRPYEYEWAFRKGPLVDAGEFRSNVSFTTQLQDLSREDADHYNFFWNPEIGIANGLQWSGTTNTHWFDGEMVWQYFETGLDFRYSQFYVNTKFETSAGELVDAFERKSATWVNEAGIVLGNRGLSFQNVNGNWDHYFNPMMGSLQLLMEASHWRKLDDANPQQGASGQILGGTTSFLTVGASGDWFRASDSTPNAYQTRAHINIASKSLRTEGPADVSPLEYRWGYIPRPGEFQLYTDFALPLKKGDISYSGEQPADPILALIQTIQDGGSAPQQPEHAISASGSSKAHATLRFGLAPHLYTSVEAAYYPDSLVVPNADKQRIWGNARAGFYSDAFLVESGLAGSHKELGPVFLRLIHKF